MGCLPSLGNDEILECFAFNAMISGIELNQYDYSVYQERILMLQTEIWFPNK